MSNFAKGLGLGLIIGYSGVVTAAFWLVVLAYANNKEQLERIEYESQFYDRPKSWSYYSKISK